MKPEKKLVKDLNEKVGPHTIRLKVIDKSNTQISAKTKGLNYQRISFQDEEGGQIKTLLYNADIKAFENIIQKNMEYDISNAKIKLTPEKYRVNAAENPYQLSFGNTTIITPVLGSEAAVGPQYITVAAIPRTITAADRYDVLAILIYVEPLRQVPRPNGENWCVRELVIMDASTEQPLVITAWAELATREGQELEEICGSFPTIGFPVVGFTSLKPSYHKGFSLATTSSTFVMLNPECEKAELLREWSNKNKVAISDKHRQVSAARNPGSTRTTITTKMLRAKKAAGTLQDERHWLHVSIPEFNRKDVRFYLGCSYCGTSSNEDIDVAYDCNTCNHKKVSSVPRMSFTFEASDETGSFVFTAFTTDAEKLLKKSALDLYKMDAEDKQSYLEVAEKIIRAEKIYIQVGPSTALSRNGALKWVLKKTSLE